MNRKIIFEIFLVMLIIVVGNASGGLPACPAPGNTAITSSCELNQSYTVAEGQNGYIIGADDVVIDGAGFTISGDVTSATCTAGQTEPCETHSGIVNNGGHNNVVVKNLEIENFCTGVVMGTSVENMTVEKCKIHDCGDSNSVTHGIHLAGAYNCTMKGNEIYNQSGTGDDTCGAGGNGISLHGVTSDENYGGDWNTIICNNLYNNVKCGIHAKFQCMHNTISHNLVTENVKAGIMPECKESNYNIVEYNNITDNGPYYGFYTRGHDNVIRHNTIINTKGADGHYNGIYISTKNPPAPFGRYNIVSNNTVCGSQAEDILIDGTAADTNDVNDNTCDLSIGGAGNGCPWNCNNLVSVYFDFDEDTYYSDEPENCECDIAGSGKCACCNPGMFNGSDPAKASYEASCDCQWTVGNDPNDCNASITPSQTQTYKISGYTDPAADTVNITNLNKPDVVDDRAANIASDFYEITLNVSDEVESGDVLRITACKDVGNYESNCNVTNYTVVNAPGEDTNVNITLNHYCLNYHPDYPFSTWEQDNWSGPAVMQMMVNHYRPVEPAQSDLNETGIAHNQACNSELEFVDPDGMRWTLNDILHNTSSYGGGNYANYGIGNYDNLDSVLHYICYWQHKGPGAAPTDGDYSNWMVIRGIHTSVNPYPQSSGSYDIYGFWINDPNPTGIGENTYKTVNQWTNDYYSTLTGVNGNDNYLNRYVAVCEPPVQPDCEIKLVSSKPRFDDAITTPLAEIALTANSPEQVSYEKVLRNDNSRKIVTAAIDGVNEELVPYDAAFAEVFAKTVSGKPKFVSGDNENYYIIPFDLSVKERLKPIKKSIADIRKIKQKTLVVVLIDAEDGSFKEASWVEDPVEYLPVSEAKALQLIHNEADISIEKPTTELVHRDASPYYPDWKVTIGDNVFFVSQDGTVSQE